MPHSALQMNGRLMTSLFLYTCVVLAKFPTNNKVHLDPSSPSARRGVEGKHHSVDRNSSDGRRPPLQHNGFIGHHSVKERADLKLETASVIPASSLAHPVTGRQNTLGQ